MLWNRLYRCGKCKSLIAYDSLMDWQNDYCPVCRKYARLTFKQKVSDEEIENYPKFDPNVEWEESAKLREREKSNDV